MSNSTESESNFRSQHDEDRILHEYFGGRRDGYYVEVGGFNGVDLSNTYFFEKLGWRGVIVEPHPVLAQACRDSRPNSIIVECAVVAPSGPPTADLEVPDGGELYASLKMDKSQLEKARRNAGDTPIRKYTVAARTLDAILEEAGATEIDFLSVDVEGYERFVLDGFDIRRWRPKVVILERDLVSPEPAIIRYMCRNGYVFKLRTGANDWYFADVPGRSQSLGYLAPLIGRHYVFNPLVAAIKTVLRPIVRPLKAKLGRQPVHTPPRPDQIREWIHQMPSSAQQQG